MKNKDFEKAKKKKVVKANELVQRGRYNLSLQQQKIILYLISQIEPDDDSFKLYEFKIADFCEICGIHSESGSNYESLKDAVKQIADKSAWVTLENGTQTIVRWIERPYISPNSGVIYIKLDSLLQPYLLQLKANFTQYELGTALAFKSKYALRLYELVKSLQYGDKPITRVYTMAELKNLLESPYEGYRDFNTRVLKPAIEEINKKSDKLISYTPIKEGRFYTQIKITITPRTC